MTRCIRRVGVQAGKLPLFYAKEAWLLPFFKFAMHITHSCSPRPIKRSLDPYMLHCNNSMSVRLFGAGAMAGTARIRSYKMVISLIITLFRTRNRYRQTLRELSALSERDLADMGIWRHDISDIARKHFAAV
jgi:uncharacterized protein YjiS (DUF1127 family)